MSAARWNHRGVAAGYGATVYFAFLVTPFRDVMPPEPLLRVLCLPLLTLCTVVVSDQLFGCTRAYRHKAIFGFLFGGEIAGLFFLSTGIIKALSYGPLEGWGPIEWGMGSMLFGLFGYALYFPVGVTLGFLGVTLSERVWLRTLPEPESAQRSK